MQPYELLRPDGTPAGVWSCGECHLPHAAATRGNQPSSELNRRAAERCCAPRTCSYCGKVTERDTWGQYRLSHEACVPPYVPIPPHPSMDDPRARLLYERMSSISEDNTFCGWITDNEFLLWDALQATTSDERPEYGWGSPDEKQLEELRILADLANGWIWTGPQGDYQPRMVTTDEWRLIRGAWSPPAGRS